jgi:8-oxo-dGTP pyrophosphatase MutT (NUDIX family)
MTNLKILDEVRLIQKCIIARDDGLILALKRVADDHSRGGKWDLPGGGYEQGEMVLDAIKREVMEEVGLTAIDPQPIFFTNKIGVTEGFFQGNNVFGMCYSCHEWNGTVVLSDEHVECKWITPEEFLQLDFGADSSFFVSSMQAFIK